MNDQEYLAKYIKAVDFISGKKKAIAICRYDDMVFIHNNKYYREITGHHDIIGKRLRDANVATSEYSDFFLKMSLKLKDEDQRFSYTIVYRSPIDNLKKCYFTTISLITNPDTMTPVGRLIEIEYLNLDFLNQILNLISSLMENKPIQKITSPIVQIMQPINLTEREKQVLFLLITGRTYKQISVILSRLTPKEVGAATIATIINRQLLPKFEAVNTEDLIEKVANMGLFIEIPGSLIEQAEGVYGTFSNTP